MARKAIVAPLVLAVGALAACAAQEERETRDIEQAVRDFIEVRELEAIDEIRTATQDSWTIIDENFLIYETRDGDYLVEFAFRCRDLETYPVIADVRQSSNRMFARFDTIRGCRLGRLFPLTEGESAELKHIGESPGSRN